MKKGNNQSESCSDGGSDRIRSDVCLRPVSTLRKVRDPTQNCSLWIFRCLDIRSVLCGLAGSARCLFGHRMDVLLKRYPVCPSLVPLLESEAVRFEQLADLRRIPLENVF
jgi:hypothetical protein